VDPTVRAVVMDGTGHWIHMEKPAEFNQQLDGFIRELGFQDC